MADSYPILGQSAPSATTQTTVYTVPASTEAIVSSITICNRGSVSATFRVAVQAGGGTVANEDYIAYNHAIEPNETVIMTVGIGMEATDLVSVYASNANLSFGVFGMEITA